MAVDPCNNTYYTEDEDNAWIGAFAGAVSAFPIGGKFIAGLIPPSMNLNSSRCIPGNKYVETTGYENLATLLTVGLVLFVIYVILRLLK